MLRIAICDDNKQFCANVKAFCVSFFGNSTDYELHVFNDGMQLLKCTQAYDILFLDIEMPSMDGFEVAEEVNIRYSDTRIVFLTSHAEMMQKAFKVKAFRYLVKPINKKELYESLVAAINDIGSNVKVIVDCSTHESKSETIVYEKDIIYIEAIGEGSIIYTVKQESLISRKPLKHWLESLTEMMFFQTHKSFIVSLKHVGSIRKGSVTTVSGM